jgi:cardiolipin synthase (CMP-forming)
MVIGATATSDRRILPTAAISKFYSIRTTDAVPSSRTRPAQVEPPMKVSAEPEPRAFQRASIETMTDSITPRRNPLSTAPNLLSVTRLCLAPFLVACILENRFGIAFTLFVVAGLTDGLDGLLARLLKQRTTLGQYLDPVADKLLISTLFLVLMYKGLMPTTVTILVFGRDLGILIVAAIMYAAVGRRDFGPSIFGKANTVAQITAVAVGLLHQLVTAKWVVTLRLVALDATVGLTILSGLHYAWLAAHRSSAHASESSED